MKLTKLFGVAALATVATFALAACGSSNSSNSSNSSDKDGVTTVKVGVMNLSDTEEARWKEVQKNLDDAKANIKLEFTQFTDYSQPNQAVRDGDVDINAFQHYNYLENWNKENSADLVSVADTYIAPCLLYTSSKKPDLGRTFQVEPASICVTDRTAVSNGETVRETKVCNCCTILVIATTVSKPRSGRAA